MGQIVYGLTLFFMFTLTVHAGNIPYEKLFNFKQGVIHHDEVWSGKILLLGDVVIPAGVNVEIKDNTWLVYNEVDLKNLGKNPDQPELIVQGNLQRPKGKNTVSLLALGDPQVQSYINSNLDRKTVAVQPRSENLQDLTQDLHKSRRYYVLIWAAVYSIWLVL